MNEWNLIAEYPKDRAALLIIKKLMKLTLLEWVIKRSSWKKREREKPPKAESNEVLWSGDKWHQKGFAWLPEKHFSPPSNAVQRCHPASASPSLINGELSGTARRSGAQLWKSRRVAQSADAFVPLTAVKNSNISQSGLNHLSAPYWRFFHVPLTTWTYCTLIHSERNYPLSHGCLHSMGPNPPLTPP